MAPKVKQRFDAAARRMTGVFRPLTKPAREIFLQDWLEECVAFVVGEAHVVPYAAQCLVKRQWIDGGGLAPGRLAQVRWLK